MSSVMHILFRAIVWLALRAGARLDPDGRPSRLNRPGFAVAALTGAVTANKAGRLVPMPDEPETSRSLVSNWALWAAVALILAVVAVGYVRRRLRSRGRPAWPLPVWGRDDWRK
jgi:hypothetical protein